MATAQELADLAAFVTGIETSDDLQAELDSVNARLEATQSQKRIAVSILDAPGYSDAEKLLLIRDTLTDPA